MEIPQKKIQYGEIYRIDNKWYLYTFKDGEKWIDYSADDGNSYIPILEYLSLDKWEMVQLLEHKCDYIKAVIKREIWS